MWRPSEFLATWTWALGAPPGADADSGARAAWLAETAARLYEALGDFAEVERASVCTATEGEDAFACDAASGGGAALLAWLERSHDVELVDLWLQLSCRAADGGGQLRVPDGALVTIDLELDDHGRLAPDPLACQLRFALHVDLFSPESRGKQPDRALAQINGPRLRAFLERLEHALALRFVELEAHGYAGAHRYGFGQR
jgi:hypothetical protein